MRRREFTSLLGSAVAVWPLAVRAQQPEHIRRIGVLMGYAESGSSGQSLIAAFRDGLQKLGWTEGRNTRIDIRWAAPDDMESIRRFAKELITLQPDLIISSTTPITAALQQQTRTIPSIFPALSDPVGSGLVASFSRPGGNITGFNVSEPTQTGKWVELLCAACCQGRDAVQHSIGAICRILANPLQGRHCLLRHGGDLGTCSRRVGT